MHKQYEQFPSHDFASTAIAEFYSNGWKFSVIYLLRLYPCKQLF
jgi:hypothetical protein